MTQRETLAGLIQTLSTGDSASKLAALRALYDQGDDIVPDLEKASSEDPDTSQLLRPVIEKLRKKRELRQWESRASALGRWFGRQEFDYESIHGKGSATIACEEGAGTIRVTIKQTVADRETQIRMLCRPSVRLTPLYFWCSVRTPNAFFVQGAWFKGHRATLKGRIQRVIPIPERVCLDVLELLVAPLLPLSVDSKLPYECLRTRLWMTDSEPSPTAFLTEPRVLVMSEPRRVSSGEDELSFWKVHVKGAAEPRSYWVTEDQTLFAAKTECEQYTLLV